MFPMSEPDRITEREERSTLRWLLAGIGLILFGTLAGFLAQQYYLRAYSDCFNWLNYTYHFREEVLRSRWPYGFPLFLKAVLPLVGPYWIFLVNLPILILNFILIAVLGGMLIRPSESKTPILPGWMGLFCWILVVSVDAGQFVHYINPFRDPLSYSLLLCSVVALIAAVHRVQRGWLFLSGVLLGLACSVREPSILMLAPYVVYGAVSWWPLRKSLSLTSLLFAFVSGFALALLPLLLQTWLATSQVLLPPQAAIESSVVPGAHFTLENFLRITASATAYVREQHPWLPLLALLGVCLAGVKRQKEILFLLLPSILIYSAFYAFYWAFVPRYFYIVSLFMVLPAGYALTLFAHAVFRRQTSRLGLNMQTGFVLVLACLSGMHVYRSGDDQPKFQIPQARAFVADFQNAVPEPEALVLSPRHLCETVSLLAQRESYALPLPYAADQTLEDMLFAPLRSDLFAGRPVYAVGLGEKGVVTDDLRFLQRAFPLRSVDWLPTAPYHMKGYSPTGIQIVQLTLPMNTVARVLFDTEENTDSIACVQVNLPSDTEGLLQRWRENELLWSRPVTRSGAYWIDWPADPPGALGSELRLHAERPIPSTFYAVRQGREDALAMDFDFFNPLDFGHVWSGAVRPANQLQRKPQLNGPASFLLDVPIGEEGVLVLEWWVRADRFLSNTCSQIRFEEKGRLLTEGPVADDHKPHRFLTALPAARRPGPRTLDLLPTLSGNQTGLQIMKAVVHEIHPTDAVDIRIGSREDDPYLRSGFFSRESAGSGATSRWTAPICEMDLYLLPGAGPSSLELTYSLQHIPDAVAARDPDVFWNGERVLKDVHRSKKTSGEVVWTAPLPVEQVQPVNRLELHSAAWSPRDFQIPDDRVFGMQLQRVRMFSPSEVLND